jgi:two-component system repressor protein LuxO
MTDTNSVIRILAVDDEPSILRLIELYLKAEGYEVVKSQDAAEARKILDEERFDAVLLDVRLPGEDGLSLLAHVKETHRNLPVLMVTAHGTVDTAVEAMRLGAYDFLLKPIERTRIKVSLKNAVAMYRLTERITALEANHDRRTFETLVGGSPGMQAVYTICENVAKSDVTVFILGESGTGKELIARAIHARSKRAKGPFIAINCAAIPRDLLESELFGHEKGSFTGADRLRLGCCEEVDGGTLFLDEICEMDFNLQSKLLRFLQEKTFKRVGGSREMKSDCRILAATNRDPLEEKDAGRFREDLYFRLNVVSIQVPPLRERGDDVDLLAAHFLQKFSERHEKDFQRIEPTALAKMRAYGWPGNVRELEHVIEGITVLNEGPELTVANLPPQIRDPQPLPVREDITDDDLEDESDLIGVRTPEDILPFKEVEKRVITEALRGCRGNVAEAARRLKLGQATLYRKIKKYNIEV